MPQHRSKQADKLPRRQGSSGAAAAAAAAASQAASDDGTHTWQRSQGAFSAKAKKEYLQWKRQQKCAAAKLSDDEQQQQGKAANSSTGNGLQDCKARAAAGSNIRQAGSAASQQQQRQQQQTPAGTADDPTQPLQYRPLVAVPAARFAATSQPAVAAYAAADDKVNTISTAAAAADAAAESAGVVYMPRLNPEEVGFTPEGFELDMPTRPAWQGVVSTADELHALEEETFQQWQETLLRKALASAADADDAAAEDAASAAAAAAVAAAGATAGSARAGGVGRLSFYEGRLEFWRQLWRTLEMSDVVLMIVDARNPLLHFSHALYRHIVHHHQLPLVLLLNKCDLVPAAAAAAWQAWLQQQLPGVTVVPVSAAAGQAEAAARKVLEVVLQQRVERGGQQVLVQEFINSSIDDLLAESLQRNVHAKRHIQQQQQQQQQQQTTSAAQQEVVGGESQTDAGSGSDAEDANAAAAADTAASGSDADSDHGGWSMRPGRKAGSRKAGKKVGGGSSSGKQQQQQQAVKGKASHRAAAAAAAAGQKGTQHPASTAMVEDGSGNESETSEGVDGSESDGESAAVHELLEQLTLERQLSSSTAAASSASSSSRFAATAAGTAAAGSADKTAAAAAAAGGDVDGGSWQHDSRPIVVGLLGEPNVGKSSTLNALLGTHRVAVSCHPGRTKHYQTHFMSSRLVLCDCPGIVFPRLDVSLPMQVLFGSYPIASCRQPYAVVRYLASASWPRLQRKLALTKPGERQQQQQQQQSNKLEAAGRRQQLEVQVHDSADQQLHQQQQEGSPEAGQNTPASNSSSGSGVVALQGGSDGWSPWLLCEAFAEKRHWVLPRSGRLDTYRAANWLLRAALGGQQGMGLAFLPPA